MKIHREGQTQKPTFSQYYKQYDFYDTISSSFDFSVRKMPRFSFLRPKWLSIYHLIL